ncbi:hypothetical protein GGU11DRAFT_331485 [Lentinula aff. detonsa]|nr:hypothetical protein GGU11DRAFT_331485 [Lentinula aff. detonsa]
MYDPDWVDDDDDNGVDSDSNDIDDNLILSLKARLTALGLHNPSPSNSPRATPLPSNSLLPSIQSPYMSNSPYLHPSPATLNGHVSLYSPHSISAPNLPLSPQQPMPYPLSPEPSSSSSYVLPFVSDEPTANSPWAGTANLYSPYVATVQSSSPYTGGYTPAAPSQAASLYTQSPYVLNTATGGSHVPLPAVSTFPYSSSVDYMDPAMYPLPASSYSSPYVPLRETPTPY